MKSARTTIQTLSLISTVILLAACSKHDSGGGTTPRVDTVAVATPTAFDINSITDTYESIASFSNHSKWSVYNVHDPSIKKFGDYYYCYSTDVGYGYDGTNLRPGIQVRKSKDLVEWTLWDGFLMPCRLWVRLT